MKQGNLFDADKPATATRPAKPPGWVVSELMTFGISRSTAEKWHASKAFAVLYSCRERKNPGLKADARRREVSAKLLTAARDTDCDTQTLHDLISEALASLDGGKLSELAVMAAALLTPPR